jgi:large subunit ribosomal protein L22
MNILKTTAIAKAVHHSPRKVGVVAALVRGRTVADALVILEHAPRRTAKVVADVIKSAAANAENNNNVNPKTLRIDALELGPGPRLKRYMPVSHGRAHPFMRRTTNIRVVVEGAVREVKKTVKTEEKA